MRSRLQIQTGDGSRSAVSWSGGPIVEIDGSPEVGGKLLCLAVGGCYMNTLLTEAGKRGIRVQHVHVDVEVEWVDDPARTTSVGVSVRVEADADEPAILDLVEHVDRIADVANSLRLGTPVRITDARVTAAR